LVEYCKIEGSFVALLDTYKSVRTFISTVKRLVREQKFHLVPTRKNKRFKGLYHWRNDDIGHTLMELASNHRLEGPNEETRADKPPGTVYVFIVPEEIDGELKNLYVKLKIPDENPERLIILSFHEEGDFDDKDFVLPGV
jgi:hypothetical protein